MNTEEIHAAKNCSCFSYDTCSWSHNLHFPHHYQQFSEKNNREDTFSSPVCEEPSQTESLIDESSFQTWRKRSKGRDYLPGSWPHAEHRAGHIWSTCLCYRWGKRDLKMFLNSPEMTQLLRRGLPHGSGTLTSNPKQSGTSHQCCFLFLSPEALS